MKLVRNPSANLSRKWLTYDAEQGEIDVLVGKIGRSMPVCERLGEKCESSGARREGGARQEKKLLVGDQ